MSVAAGAGFLQHPYKAPERHHSVRSFAWMPNQMLSSAPNHDLSVSVSGLQESQHFFRCLHLKFMLFLHKRSNIFQHVCQLASLLLAPPKRLACQLTMATEAANVFTALPLI